MDARRDGPRRSRTHSLVLLACSAVCLAPAGCSGFWDEVTARDFTVKGWISPPDPLVVLRDSSNGDQRARALRVLREPKQTGGTDKDQDFIVQVLTTAATTERASLCRLAALESLETFKDPRVVKALEDAYYRAGSFPPETASIIRCRAVDALGKVGQPSAIDFLVRVLREPPVAADSSDAERQQKTDERTAAARALGRFRGRASAEALVAVLQTEQDLALRDRVRDALVATTGRDFPADGKLWADYLKNAGADQPTAVVEEKGFGEKLLHALSPVSWWE